MTKNIAVLVVLLFIGLSTTAQSPPFGIHIQPVEITGLGGLQSFAHGQHGGKWLIIGGRLDGLHRRQPFAAFDVAGNNNQLIVVDPISRQKWSAPLTTLPIALQEQLSSTNMQYHQQGDYLYVVGGYGYHNATASRKTFANLTAVRVPELIAAIIAGDAITPYFRQVSDLAFAVTGGHLKKINNTFYLIGGNKFDGNYNPMGHATFTQVYTDAIRKFTLSDDGSTLTINHLPTITDAANLHRRDYNAVPQIMPNGAEGITVFSGVFQPNVDLPFLNCVNIDSVGYQVNNNFQQYYNHYHCAVLPLYSANSNEMHTVFLGGIAQYYEEAGVLVQDNNVPFVKTIARVTRAANGQMAEYKLPLEMPGLLGAGAEFIALPNLAQYPNEVIKLDEFTADTTLVGFIYGGISSSAPNIFFSNTGNESSASSQLFEVYLLKNAALSVQPLNTQSTGTLKLQLFPNPNAGEFDVRFNLKQAADVKITLRSASGKEIHQVKLKGKEAGEQRHVCRVRKSAQSGTYFITLETPYESATQKVVITD